MDGNRNSPVCNKNCNRKDKNRKEMKAKNLKEQVYQAILESIYASEYLPDQILTESELIQRFGYSKSPIREALSALCHEGILRNIPRCGYQIVALTSEDIQNIQQYRLILESGMIQAGFSHMTEDYFRKLEHLATLCSQHTDNIISHWIYNRDFHVALISAAGNAYACEQLSNSMMLLYRAYAQIHWRKTHEPFSLSDMKYHTRIIEALRKKDLDSAIAYLKKDFQDFGSK